MYMIKTRGVLDTVGNGKEMSDAAALAGLMEVNL